MPMIKMSVKQFARKCKQAGIVGGKFKKAFKEYFGISAKEYLSNNLVGGQGAFLPRIVFTRAAEKRRNEKNIT